MNDDEYRVLLFSRFVLRRRGFRTRLFTLSRSILQNINYIVNKILQSKIVTISTTFLICTFYKYLHLLYLSLCLILICSQLYLCIQYDLLSKGYGVSGIWSLSSPHLLTEIPMLWRRIGGRYINATTLDAIWS